LLLFRPFHFLRPIGPAFRNSGARLLNFISIQINPNVVAICRLDRDQFPRNGCLASLFGWPSLWLSPRLFWMPPRSSLRGSLVRSRPLESLQIRLPHSYASRLATLLALLARPEPCFPRLLPLLPLVVLRWDTMSTARSSPWEACEK